MYIITVILKLPNSPTTASYTSLELRKSIKSINILTQLSSCSLYMLVGTSVTINFSQIQLFVLILTNAYTKNCISMAATHEKMCLGLHRPWLVGNIYNYSCIYRVRSPWLNMEFHLAMTLHFHGSYQSFLFKIFQVLGLGDERPLARYLID